MNVGIATQNINAAFIYLFIFLATPELKPAFHRGTSSFGHLVVVFLKIETTINNNKKILSLILSLFEPGSKNVSPEKSCTKITK